MVEHLTNRNMIKYEEKRYKPLAETYQKITTALCLFMMYPNPDSLRRRIPMLVFLLATFIPAYIMFFYDVGICISTFDIVNLTRQFSIGIPLMFAQLKLVFATAFRDRHKNIIDAINRDYEKFNDFGDEYVDMFENTKNKILRMQNIWGCITAFTSIIFPMSAAVFMAYFYIKGDPKRIMVHEMAVPFMQSHIYESPYFEIIFVYMVFICAFLSGAFYAYDSLFFVCVYHICLKMEIVCYMLSKVFENPKDVLGIKRKMRDAIFYQNDAFRMIQDITKTYEIWLMLVFMLTVLQLCMCMMQIVSTSGEASFDIRYLIVTTSSVIHVFLPCHMASMITTAGTSVATAAYFSGWEDATDVGLRKNIAFIIARSQEPIKIKPMNMVVFDMELFVLVLQKSYAVYTLMRPN